MGFNFIAKLFCKHDFKRLGYIPTATGDVWVYQCSKCPKHKIKVLKY